MTTDTTSSTSTPTPVAAAATIEARVDGALSAYCDPDRARREARIAELWAPDGELVDPPLEGRGHAQLSDLADLVLTHYPDHIFRRTSGVDAHHGRGRYAWELVAPTGAVAVSGLDVIEFAPDGRVQRIVGFFGPLPEIG
jgi:hypothetical protein